MVHPNSELLTITSTLVPVTGTRNLIVPGTVYLELVQIQWYNIITPHSVLTHLLTYNITDYSFTNIKHLLCSI